MDGGDTVRVEIIAHVQDKVTSILSWAIFRIISPTSTLTPTSHLFADQCLIVVATTAPITQHNEPQVGTTTTIIITVMLFISPNLDQNVGEKSGAQEDECECGSDDEEGEE